MDDQFAPVCDFYVLKSIINRALLCKFYEAVMRPAYALWRVD